MAMKPKKKILYVDDDDRTLNIVSKYLISSGYRVLTSTTPFVASLIDDQKPDLIILDIGMPLLSGDRIAEILSRQGYAPPIPILFFSGENVQVVEQVTRQFPSSTYVSKQSGLEALKEKVCSLLG